MEYFSEEHAKLLFSKEWLAKVDSRSSTPYLIKFYSSPVDLSCHVVVTDTKNTWAEVINSNQFARRWRDCNRDSGFVETEDEEEWRTSNLELLSQAHTLGGVADVSFEVRESDYADLAFQMDSEEFKWRWETVFVGHKMSAEILSKHLIMPLMSVNHLAFSSVDPVNAITDTNLEKAIDKVGRTARRTPDTHIKNSMSKPRLSTTLRRMTAIFNFLPDLPPVISEAKKPNLQVHCTKAKTVPDRSINQPSMASGLASPSRDLLASKRPESMSRSVSPNGAKIADSATESENEEGPQINVPKGVNQSMTPAPPSLSASVTANVPDQPSARSPKRQFTPPQVQDKDKDKRPVDDSDSSPLRRPAKKAKPMSSSDDDSEEERKQHIAQLKSGARTQRGTRQPIKRGGKRF